MDAVLYDLVSKKNWVCEEFLVGDNFTAKSDIVFLEGCAGGGGGHPTGTGGTAGQGCAWLPVPVTKGATYSVAIGAGGAIGGNGGNTSFGSLVTLSGGSGGGALSGSYTVYGGGRGWVSPYGYSVYDSFMTGHYVIGASILISSGNVVAIGAGPFKSSSGTGGMFGPGGVSGVAADANSGAGGGTNAHGGSGRMRVYYFK